MSQCVKDYTMDSFEEMKILFLRIGKMRKVEKKL